MRPSTKNEKHEFALFFPAMPQKPESLVVTDPVFIHRIAHILRLNVNDSIILFDRTINGIAQIVTIQKKLIELSFNSIKKNLSLVPNITIGLPLLKRDSFEQALYAATELGANEIQLLITEKSQRIFTQKEMIRAQNIVHAAAEQSKNFAFPILHEPISLPIFCQRVESDCVPIFFDPHGEPIAKVVNNFSMKDSKAYTLLVGPEGDLSSQEKELLRDHTYRFVQLTPTILRSYQALTIGLGIFRSFL